MNDQRLQGQASALELQKVRVCGREHRRCWPPVFALSHLLAIVLPLSAFLLSVQVFLYKGMIMLSTWPGYSRRLKAVIPVKWLAQCLGETWLLRNSLNLSSLLLVKFHLWGHPLELERMLLHELCKGLFMDLVIYLLCFLWLAVYHGVHQSPISGWNDLPLL